MDNLLQDIRYGFRMLRKHRVFTAVAALTLALGIGANSTIFSLVNAVLLKPLPVYEPDRVVSLYAVSPDGARSSRFSYPDYADYRDQAKAFTGLAAVTLTPLTLGAGERSESILGELVSGNFFSLLGVSALPGRTFLPEEDRPEASRVVVVSRRCWERRFASDPDLVGRTIHLNGDAFTVIGIASKQFTGTSLGPAVDVWVPLRQTGDWLGPDWIERRDRSQLRLLGRLAPGVTTGQAQAALATLAAGIARDHPESHEGKSIDLVPASLVEGRRRNAVAIFLSVLLAVVGFVLLIASANVANLLLIRAVGRRREIAIRQALGATRRRVIRLLLIESVLLALVGGAAGLLISLWAGQLLFRFNPLPTFAIEFDLGVDWRVLTFSLLVSIGTGLALGLAPAVEASRPDLVLALKDEARSGVGSLSKSRLRNSFVIAQVALSMVLLIGAGLLLRSLENEQAVNPGFDPQNVFAMDFDLDLKGLSETQGRQFYKSMLERIAALPEVKSATLANRAPLDISTPTIGALIEGHSPPPGSASIAISFYRITPGYFQTIALPLTEGRDFNERDSQQAPAVVIVNQAMARRFWPGDEAVGKRFLLAPEGARGMPSRSVEVVGVAKDSRYRTLAEPPTPHLYLPLLQNYDSGMTLLVRAATGESGRLMPAVRAELQAIDKDPQAFFARTMQEHLAVALAPGRIAATMLAVFGLLALLLAVIGIYGVVSYAVSQRGHEIGIRMALGAGRGDIFKLIVGGGLRLALVGVGAGVLAALALTRFLESFLFGVSATDLATFAVASVLFTAVALAASYLPARRALRVDPAVALRHE